MQVQTAVEVKEERLRAELAELPSLIVALSGGTDSAYLAWVANGVLGPSAITQGGSSTSARNQARMLAEEF